MEGHVTGGNVAAWVDGKPVCRSCCERHNIQPWYIQDRVWQKMQAEKRKDGE